MTLLLWLMVCLVYAKNETESQDEGVVTENLWKTNDYRQAYSATKPNQTRRNSNKQSISVLTYNLLLKGWQPPCNQKSKLNLWYRTYSFISRGSFSSAAQMPNYYSILCGLYMTDVFLYKTFLDLESNSVRLLDPLVPFNLVSLK